MVASEVEVLIGNASIHLECASITFSQEMDQRSLDVGEPMAYEATPRDVRGLPEVTSCLLYRRCSFVLSFLTQSPSLATTRDF